MFDKHEPAEFELTPDLAAMERQLARLTPAAPRIDRDRLMFAAGHAAVGRTLPEGFPTEPKRLGYIAGPSRVGGWFWPAATATMTAATLLLATMLVRQRAGQSIAVQPPTLIQPSATATVLPTPSVDVTTSITPAAVQSENFGWPMASPPTAGYLGLRYIALTRGVGELETHSRTASSGADSIDNTPATQRELLRELLPSAQHKVAPRSHAAGRNS